MTTLEILWLFTEIELDSHRREMWRGNRVRVFTLCICWTRNRESSGNLFWCQHTRLGTLWFMVLCRTFPRDNLSQLWSLFTNYHWAPKSLSPSLSLLVSLSHTFTFILNLFLMHKIICLETSYGSVLFYLPCPQLILRSLLENHI